MNIRWFVRQGIIIGHAVGHANGSAAGISYVTTDTSETPISKQDVWNAIQADGQIRITWENGPWVSGHGEQIIITGTSHLEACGRALTAAGIKSHARAGMITVVGDAGTPCPHPAQPQETATVSQAAKSKVEKDPATREAKILAAALGLVDALEFYADPDSYSALMVVGDSPCGDFLRDAAVLTDEDTQYWEDYRGAGGGYYGKKAREALAQWRAAHRDD